MTSDETFRFGLSPEVIIKIQSVFQEYAAIRKVIVYGSRAMGTFKDASDIDLTLDEEGLTSADLSKIETQLDDLLLPYKIDLSTLRQIENPSLLEHIKKHGQSLS